MGRRAPDTEGASRRVATRQVEAALARYGLRDDRFVLLEREEQGKLLFRVGSPNSGCFLLRLHETRLVGGAGLRSEMLWLRALSREARLPVPEPIPATDGSLVSRVAVEGTPEGRLCVLLRWVPGLIRTWHLTPQDLFAVGSLVARMHRYSERYAVPEGFVRPRAYDWERVFGHDSSLWREGPSVYSSGELAVFRAVAERTRQDLREMGERRDAFGIIHSDLTPGNFVFHGGEAYIIDFDNCAWGHYLYDLTVTLSALEAYAERRARMRAAFLEGYRRERHLPRDCGKYLATFRALRIVRRVVRTLERGTLAERPWGPRRFSRAAERLEKFVASNGKLDLMDLSPP